MRKHKVHPMTWIKKLGIVLLTAAMLVTTLELDQKNIQAANANITFTSGIVKKFGESEPIASVASGEPFFLAIGYNVNAGGDGLQYKNGMISIQLPENIVFDELVHTAGNDVFQTATIRTTLGHQFLDVKAADVLETGNSGTVYLKMHFKNMVTIDGTTADFSNMVMTGNINADAFDVYIPSTTVTATAFQNWTVQKGITKQEGDSVKVIHEDGHQYYQVLYNINIDPQEGNRYGRLQCDPFLLRDTLPQGYPEGGGAAKVEVSSGNKTLQEGKDFTLERHTEATDTSIQSIAFSYVNTFVGSSSSAQNMVPDGTPINTTYTVRVLYPYESYEIPANHDFIQKILVNKATLEYKPLGKAKQLVESSATIQLGWQDKDRGDHAFQVVKTITVGAKGTPSIGKEETNVYDETLQKEYEKGTTAVAFGLYTDEACTLRAKDSKGTTIPAQIIDAEGIVSYRDLNTGTYYLKEEVAPTGFKKAAVKKIEIAKDGSIKADGTILKDQQLKVDNTTDTVGYAAFWKRGTSATSSTGDWLSDVSFTMTSKTDSSKSYHATSDNNGLVLFQGIPSGEYTIREDVSSDEEFLPNDHVYPITVKANQVNYPSGMEEYSGYPFVKNESNKGKFLIHKISATDKNVLTGAEFQAYRVGDTKPDVTSFHFDDGASDLFTVKGNEESPALEEGWYVVKESKAPNGYTLDETLYAIQVTRNVLNQDVTIENEPKGQLEVHKYGSLTAMAAIFSDARIAIDGSEFTLYDADKKPMLDEKGDPIVIKPYVAANGTAVSASVALDAGTYFLLETRTPYGYVSADPTAYLPITITKGQKTVQDVMNVVASLGQLQLTKTSTKDTALLENAVFEVRDAKDQLVETLTTGADGQATSNFLPAGTYTVKEIKAPQGFILSEKVISVTIENNKRTEVQTEIANQPYVNYQLKKVDSTDPTKTLQGVHFRLYEVDPDMDAHAKYREFTTDAQGLVTFDRLVPKTTYYFKESSTLAEYTLNTETQSFIAPEVSATKEDLTQATAPAIVENMPKGKLYVEKTLIPMNATTAVPLAGINFYYYPKISDDASVDKHEAQNQKTYQKLGTTSILGTIQSSLLDAKAYWIEEEGNDLYKINTPKAVNVSAGQTVKATTNTAAFQNEYTKGQLAIEKVSSADSTIKVVASFHLYKKLNGTTPDYTTATPVLSFTTNGNGTFTSGYLAEGEYVLIEQSVTGAYLLDNTPIDVTIKAGQTTAFTNDKAITNTPTGVLRLKKYESWNHGSDNEVNLAGGGFTFHVYTAQPAKDGDADAVKGADGAYYKPINDSYQTLTSDGNGSASISGLAPGSYIVKEVLNNEQKKDYTEALPQVVDLKAGGTANVTFKNVANKGKLKVIKTDETGKPLDDAQFTIYREAKAGERGEEIMIGSATYQVVDMNLTYKIRSGTAVIYDKDGTAHTDTGVGFSGLLQPDDTYFLKETTLPSGYLAESIWTKVGTLEAGKLAEVTVKNYQPITSQGKKVDQNGKTVAGATFAILTDATQATQLAAKSDTELQALLKDEAAMKKAGILQSAVSKADGMFAFKDLDETGTYYVIEMQAPHDTAGNATHERDTAVHTVTVTKVKGAYYLYENGALLTIQDAEYGRLWIKKELELAGSKTPLNGIAFDVHKAQKVTAGTIGAIAIDGSWYVLKEKVDTLLTGTDTSTGNGGAVSIHLAPGTYVLVEREEDLSKSMGIVLQDSDKYHVISMELEDHKEHANSPIINRTEYGKFYLKKVSSNDMTGTSLQASFDLFVYDESKKAYVAYDAPSAITTTHGELYQADFLLPAGTYRLLETAVESGYTKTSDPIDFTIEANKITGMNASGAIQVYAAATDAKQQPILVENTPQGRVALTKKGYMMSDTKGVITKTNLGNAQFDIYKKVMKDGALDFSSTHKVGTAKSDTNGKLMFTNLAGKTIQEGKNWLDAGSYILKETAVGNDTTSGYQADFIGAFDVLADTETQQIQRVDAKGQTQDVYNTTYKSELLNGTIVNESQYGRLQLTKIDEEDTPLAAVSFTIYQKDVKGAYQKVADMQTDSTGIATSKLLPKGQYYVQETKTPHGFFADTQYYGPYQIEPMQITSTDAAGKAITVVNERKQSLKIIKQDATTGTDIAASAMEGTTFELYRDAEGKQLVGTATYDKDKGIVFQDLRPLTAYYIKEVKAPVGYDLHKEFIKVPETLLSGNTIHEFIVKNDPLGSLRIEKVGEWELSGGKTETLPLQDAEFTLYEKDGTTVVAKGTTDNKGQLTLQGLVAGEYVLKETKAPSGFVLDNSTHAITIEQGKQNTDFTGTKAIINRTTLGKFMFHKADADGKPLAGAYFKLVKVEGSEEHSISSAFDTFTIESDGTFSSAALAAGTYKLYETTAPDGYTKISPVQFEIESQKVTRLSNGSGTTEGLLVDDAQATITIVKYDDASQYGETDHVLAGVHFGLYTYDTNQLIAEKVSDAQGKIVWDQVNPGKYYVQEIDSKDNPIGYEYKDTCYTVEVATGQATTVNYYPNHADGSASSDGKIVNSSTMGRIVIKKLDANSKDALEGAEFKLYQDAAGTKPVVGMASFTSDAQGYAVSDLLPAAVDGTTYYVKETKAPSGYTLDEQLQEIIKEIKVYPLQRADAIKAFQDKNYIEFQNTKTSDLLAFDIPIKKGLTTAMKEKETASESLSLSAYSTTFAIRDFANGKNTIPADTIEVSDTKTTLQYYDASQSKYLDLPQDQLTDTTYAITSVNIYRAYNNLAKASTVSAKLYYKGLYDTAWKEVPNGEFQDLQNYGSSARSISIDESLKAMHLKVVYTGAKQAFISDGFDYDVTFQKRESLNTYNEVRRITNVADVTYNFSIKDENGADKAHLDTLHKASNVVAIELPPIIEKTPTVHIAVAPSDPNGTDKKTYKPGDVVQYDIDVQNLSTNGADFLNPVVSFDLPIGMSLNDVYPNADPANPQRFFVLLLEEDGTTGTTLPLSDLLIRYTPVENARVVDGGALVETKEPTTKVTFQLRDGTTIKPGRSLRITLGATIATNQVSGSLWMPTYLNSNVKTAVSKENPYGNSFDVNVTQPGISSNPLVEDTVLDQTIGSATVGGDKFANSNAQIDVNENNSLSIFKQVKGVYDNNYLNYTNIGQTSPGGSIDYNIQVTNGTDSDRAVNKLRIVDLLPFYGDSYVGRDNVDGSITTRTTAIERETLLKGVDVSNLPTGASYTIYYCIDEYSVEHKWDKWKAEERQKTTADNELPMLYKTMNESAWTDGSAHTWIKAQNVADSQLQYVSAVAVEVEFQAGHELGKGSAINMHIAMEAPLYGTGEDEVAEYQDKRIANSAMVAVGREGHSETINNSDRTENQEVKVELTTPKGALGDYAFYDINRNGLQDAEDAPIAGLPVTLHVFKNGVETGTLSTLTDTAGYYEFKDLDCNVVHDGASADSKDPNDFAGGSYYDYQVEFALPNAASRYTYEPTTRYAKKDGKAVVKEDSNIGTDPKASDYLKSENVRLTAIHDGTKLEGVQDMSIDAGFTALGALGDRIWYDANKNGIQDEDEHGVNGVTVRLYEATADGKIGALLETAISEELYGKDGYYLFEKLVAGEYIVEFDTSDIIAGGYSQYYGFTQAKQGSETEDDSNAVIKVDDRIMRSEVIHFKDRGYDMSIDAGLILYSALSGIAFEDRNYSGTQELKDNTDVPVPGTIVELYAINENDGTRSTQPLAKQTVGEDGAYFFDHLSAGQYQVNFTFPKAYELTDANVGDDRLDSDVEYEMSSDLRSGFTDIIRIDENELVQHVDAGASRFSALGDYVWFDADQDGLQGNPKTEPGIKDVPVYL